MIFPSDFSMIPRIVLNNVDFPAPLCPTSAITEPDSRSKVIPSKRVASDMVAVTFFTSNAFICISLCLFYYLDTFLDERRFHLIGNDNFHIKNILPDRHQ